MTTGGLPGKLSRMRLALLPVVGLILATSLGAACNSALRAGPTRVDASSDSGVDANPVGGSPGTGDVGGPETGGVATGGAAGATSWPDAGLCQEISAPYLDCAVDTGGNDAENGEVAASCDQIAARIAEQIPIAGTCTAVVRLDYSSLQIVDHAFVCGAYAPTTESSARAAANQVTFPNVRSPAGNGRLWSGPEPADEWVFYEMPGDWGGMAVVSARSGLLVFAGTVDWGGAGLPLPPSAWDTISRPLTWDTSDLGGGCPRPDGLPVRDLSLGYGPTIEHLSDAADVALATALPSAFARWGSLFDVMVLLYPRSLGPIDVRTTEYIVFLNGGTPDTASNDGGIADGGN